MDTALDVVVAVLLGLGCLFSLTSGVGLLRMPDFYSRVHPAGKNDTLGTTLIFAGLMVRTWQYDYGWLVAARIVLIVLLIYVTAPTSTHAITRAAHLDGLRPWTGEGEGEEESKR